MSEGEQPQPAAEVSEAPYNTTFERLVHDDTDIVGMIAYAKYKQEKQQWAANVRLKSQRGPSPQELEQYVSTMTEARIEGLRRQAEGSISDFAAKIIDDATPDIERNLLEGSFERDIRNGVIASLIYTVILIAVAFVLKALGIDLLGVYQAIGGATANP